MASATNIPALLTIVLVLLVIERGRAEVGVSDDPFGSAGAFKPQVETGGGYSPHNGNATRSVTDLEVPGAVGSGLAFTRHWNSTDESFGYYGPFAGAGPFAYGGWSHSWSWVAILDWDDIVCEGCFPRETWRQYYVVLKYPDGRTVKFEGSSLDVENAFSGNSSWKGPQYSGDYLVGMTSSGSNFWLHLADGRSVYFERNLESFFAEWRAIKVIDPNGLETVLRYDDEGGLESVKEPAGRELKITWDYVRHPRTNEVWLRVIRRVESGMGLGSQAVEYDYDWFPDETRPTTGWHALTGTRHYTQGAFVPDDGSIYDYIGWTSQAPPSAIEGAGPLLREADDGRFEGPMTRIQYTFRGGPGGGQFCEFPNPVPVPPYGPYLSMVPFPVEQELSGATGLLVSGFYIPCNGKTDTGTRTETRGAGGQRKFYFGLAGGLEPGARFEEVSNGPDRWYPPEAAPVGNVRGYNATFELTKLTQFADAPESAPFEFCHYKHWHPWRTFDARGTLTHYEYEPSFRTDDPYQPSPRGDGTSRVKRIERRGSDNSVRKFNRTDPGASHPRGPNLNPYTQWLFSETDEQERTTTYTRDSRRRVTRIQYHGGSEEAFIYNNFNQITNHTLPSGAVKSYEYDSRGLLKREWNSVDGGHANGTIYTHDEFDRVKTVSHGWSREKGALFSVKMSYNARHQVLTEEYPPTHGVPQPAKEYRYDRYGNCIGIKNELGAWSNYTYDEYRRCTSYTEPLNAPNGNNTGTVASRTWNWIYDRWYQPPGSSGTLRDASTHTSKQWRVQIEPAFNAANDRRLSARKFDYSDRIIEEVTGMIQAGATGNWQGTADTEVRSYSYDENGNKKRFTDALGRVTDYLHSRRDFLTKITEYPDPAIGGAPRVTETDYDTSGNKTLVKFPDSKTQQWLDHDGFGQPARFIDERNNTTNLYYDWGPMKKLGWVITHRTRDGGGIEPQATRFLYDGMGRKQWILYPNGTSELWDYGLLGQLKTFKTRGGQAKRIEYDARGREDNHTWDGNAAPGIDRTWDDANRLTGISNIFSTIDYKYDDAGQVRWEGNNIKGSGVRAQMDFYRYPSGEVGTLKYPNGIALRKVYTARGQLKTIGFNNSADRLVDYYYRPDGKVNYSTYWNGVSTTNYGYDGRGMIGSIHHVRTAFGLQGNLGYRGYWRDARDRIWAWQRGTDNSLNGKEVGNGTKFQYDAEGQVTDAWYLAQDPAGNMNSPVAQEHFKYDELGNRTGENVLYPSGTRTFTGKDTGVNQYRAWWPYSIINYDDDVAWPANGVLMQEGNITAGFNALNQPMFITGTAYNGTANWMHFGFDPLGRCVKRWVGPLSASGWTPSPETNPATYFYYDGWNIAQEGPGGGAVSRTYAHGARVDEIIASSNETGAVFFHHYDALGNCILISDGAGVLREQYDYQAFGTPYFYNPAGTNIFSSPWGNRFLFKGREWLTDLKLYDNRHRLYSVGVGRFLQPDPTHFEGGDYNLYRYCHNDPVNKSDPMGLEVGDWWDLRANFARAQEIGAQELAKHKGVDNLQDAIRHSEWMRRTTVETNWFTAFVAGTGYEAKNILRQRNLKATAMDLNNNQAGRVAGLKRKAVDEQKLRTIPKSAMPYKDSEVYNSKDREPEEKEDEKKLRK